MKLLRPLREHVQDLLGTAESLSKDVELVCSDGRLRWSGLLLAHWAGVVRREIPEQERQGEGETVVVLKDFSAAVVEKVLSWSLLGEATFPAEEKKEVLDLMLAVGAIPRLSQGAEGGEEEALLCLRCGQTFAGSTRLEEHAKESHQPSPPWPTLPSAEEGEEEEEEEEVRAGYDPYLLPNGADEDEDVGDGLKVEVKHEWEDEEASPASEVESKLPKRRRGRPRKKKRLKEEEEEEEEEEGKTECKDCQENFSSPSDLRLHLRSAHRHRHPAGNSRKKEAESHLCDACGGAFASQQSLAVHRFRKHGMGQGKECPLCTKKFLDNCNLMKHVSTVHEGRKDFLCGTCGSSFAYKGALTRHVLMRHQGVRVQGQGNRCDLCGSVFTWKLDLDRHKLAVHQKAKPFECKVCDFSTADSRRLKKHVAVVHENVRPHICDVCGKAFPDIHRLSFHKKGVHMGVKDYTCKLCGHQLTKKSYMRSHYVKVHNLSTDELKNYLKDRPTYLEKLQASNKQGEEQIDPPEGVVEVPWHKFNQVL